MREESNVYVDADVHLDGNEYSKCRFTECRLIYSGGPPPSFSQCEFSRSQFHFEGSAGNTVFFLRGLSQPGSGLQTAFKQIFPMTDHE